jgi:hypothetical protein
VEGAGAGVGCVLAGGGDFFFFAFFATVAQVGAGAAEAGLEAGGGGGIGAEVDSGLGAGVGDGGDSVFASLSTRISSLRALICAKRMSVLSVNSFCISLRKLSTKRSGLSVEQSSEGSWPRSEIA